MFKPQQFFKAIVYRIYSSLITFGISFLFTKNVGVSASIGLLDLAVKVFSYYLFDEIWAALVGIKLNPAVIFLTGLSGSGKTTIANDLVRRLKKKSIVPVLLDGDEIRKAIHLTGFDEESRKKHNLNVGYMACLLERQEKIVIVSLISPYDDIRKEIRNMCKNFIEVYLSTDLDVCIKRDPKGLYKKALAGEIKDFTGISAPYQPPADAELILDTAVLSVEECSSRVLQLVKKR
jgi:adenylylsulfate kinase